MRVEAIRFLACDCEVVPTNYKAVFVPGGFPQYTYNPRAELQLEKSIHEVLENLCKLVTVTGQTKSGKTVLVRRILSRDKAVWVDGGQVRSEDDFFGRILEELDAGQVQEAGVVTEAGASVGGKTSGEGSVLVIKASAEVNASGTVKRAKSTVAKRTVSTRVAALRSLAASRTPLVIDDFHYIDRELQGQLVRSLKPLVFEGHPVVLIAIPHRRYDAMKVEREMTGRILSVQVPPWSDSELKFIPNTGFRELNCVFGTAAALRFVAESIGSPHLMQEFCRVYCSLVDLQSSGVQQPLDPTTEQVDSVFKQVAETIGRPIFEKLAKGPRQRSDRIPRMLRSGAKVDIYGLVLHALAYIKPGLVSIEYEELRTAAKAVSEDAIPQLHEIARVLKHMATIAATDESSTPVIDFEESEKKLHITDPFFAFYLRWGSIA